MASNASTAADSQTFEEIVDKANGGEGLRNILRGMAKLFGHAEPKPALLAFKNVAAFLERNKNIISARAVRNAYAGTSADGSIQLEFDVQPPFEISFLPDGKANTLDRKSVRPSLIYIPARLRVRSQPSGRS
jgi:hypothetical protein